MKRLLVIFLATTLSASVIADIRYKLATGDLISADAVMEEFCRDHQGTSECAAALSWMARGAQMMKDYPAAQQYLDRTNALTQSLLKKSKVEDDSFLATAVGSSYEVQSRVLAVQGKRDEAIALLNQALPKWKFFPIEARLRKNLNLLTLVGAKAPLTYPDMLGKPTLLFLWGHWCGDCKAQSPAMGRIWSHYKTRGLTMIAPTRRQGSIGDKDNVSASEEDSEIERVWKESYSELSDVPHPVDLPAMLAYGVSSTPTIVLVDRHGVVRMYEPYRMSEQALAKRIDDLLR